MAAAIAPSTPLASPPTAPTTPTAAPSHTRGTATTVDVPRGPNGPPAPPRQGGTVDLARQRPVTASGHTQTYVPSNAVDGNPDTYWESTDNAFPQSITVDLGSVQTIGRLELRVPPLSDWLARVQTIQIIGDSGTIVGPRAYDFEPGNGNAVSIPLPATSTQHVRLVFTSNNDWPAGQLSTFAVYSAS
jgi:hypothetical protein